MSLTPREIESLAHRLWQARVSLQSCEPLSTSYPQMTLSEAYQISSQNYNRRLTEHHVKGTGKKIGLTSHAVQKQLGVNQPDFGYLTSDMLLEDHGVLKSGLLIQGRVEGEVAFALKKDLQGPGITFQDVIQSTDYVVACIEIIDSRIRDWKIQIQDTVADNASSAFFVLGSTRRKPDTIDLRMAGMTLRKNGEVESTGVGAACLDHPMHAVAWLANALGDFGEKLRAGDLILSGAYGPVVPFHEKDQCEVQISGLGKVSCSYGI